MNRRNGKEEPVLSSASSYDIDVESASRTTTSDPDEYLKSPLSFRGQQSPAMIGGRKAKKHAHTRERHRAEHEMVYGEGFDLSDTRRVGRRTGPDYDPSSPRSPKGGAPHIAKYTVSPVASSPMGRRSVEDDSDTQSLTEFLFGSGGGRLNYYTPTHVSTVHPMDASLYAVGDSIVFPSRNAIQPPAIISSSSSSSIVESSESSSVVESSSTSSVSSSSTPEEEEEEESESCTTSSSSTEDPYENVEIPQIYLDAAERLEIQDPKKQLGPFFKEDEGSEQGLKVPRLVTSFKYRQNLLQSIPCSLKASKTSPVLIISTPQAGTYRYLVPDPQVQHSLDKSSLSAFTGYESEQGQAVDEVLEELKSNPGVYCRFKNTRAPIWFQTESAEDETRLSNCLKVMTEVWKAWLAGYHFSVAEYQRPATVPMPSLMNGKKRQRLLKHLPADHSDKEEHFGRLLNTRSSELISSRAVGMYWKTERLTWVYFRSMKDGVYKGKYLRIFVHPYGPHLMICDKRGGILKGVLDVHTYSIQNDGTGRPSIIGEDGKSDMHITHMNLLNDPHPIYFAFETKEDLQDFQQTVATISYMLTESGKIVPN